MYDWKQMARVNYRPITNYIRYILVLLFTFRCNLVILGCIQQY